jgi:glycosyltransferase involved in cell wall biosynthesis
MNVTVLIPVYNREQYISDAIKSALAATVPCKVLVSDDASTDRTPAVVERLVNEYPDRIRLMRLEVNGGESVARNLMLDAADTEFACWLDSDDLMEVSRIENQLAALKRERADIVWSGYATFSCVRNRELQHMRRYPEPNLTKWWDKGWEGLTNNVTNPTGFFRVEPLRQYRFPEAVRWGGQDTMWSYTIFRHHHPVAVIPEVLYHMRQHEGRISIQKKHHVKDKKAEADVITQARFKVETETRMYSDAFWTIRKKETPLLNKMGQILVNRLSGIRSMVDMGCGIGTLLEGAQQAGVTKVDGFDLGVLESRPYVDTKLRPIIHGANLNQPLHLVNTHDCATSLEVAEHLPESAADTFVENLTNAATKWIVITAAPPGQGGVDHINCQPKEYWIEKFTKRGWKLHEEITQTLSDCWKSFLPPPKFYYWTNVLVFH